MNKKSYKRVLALCFALLSSSSCGITQGSEGNLHNAMLGRRNNSAPMTNMRKSHSKDLSSKIIVPATLAVLLGASKYCGWGPFSKQDNQDDPYNPGMPLHSNPLAKPKDDDVESPKGDHDAGPTKNEEPDFADMYQRTRYVLGLTCLKDCFMEYLSRINYLDDTYNPSNYYSIYLGHSGKVVPFADFDVMKKKAFLVTFPNAEINAFLNGFSNVDEAEHTLEEWKAQNVSCDAGKKYNALVNLINLPINTQQDIDGLAKALRESKIVNEKECISVGVTSFKNKQNRICVAMYGHARDAKHYKKIVTSCAKGLHLKFDKSFYTCDTSDTEFDGETKTFYFITPTSIEEI